MTRRAGHVTRLQGSRVRDEVRRGGQSVRPKRLTRAAPKRVFSFAVVDEAHMCAYRWQVAGEREDPRL